MKCAVSEINTAALTSFGWHFHGTSIIVIPKSRHVSNKIYARFVWGRLKNSDE